MRQFLTILSLTLGLFDLAFGDAGNCVKYDVDIELNDGQKISGFVYGLGYQKKIQFDDISFLDYIKVINPLDTLHVYKNIRPLPYPLTNIKTENCEFHFDATTSDNDIRILKNSIKDIKVISHTICNNCDIDNRDTGYFWNGIYPTIITELTKVEIDKLQTKPTSQVNFGHDFINSNTESYWLISYNQKFDEDELIKIQKNYLRNTNDLLKNNDWDSVQIEYRKLKMELRRINVIVFKIEYAL